VDQIFNRKFPSLRIPCRY